MSRPGQTITLNDPGMTTVRAGARVPLFLGTASSGTAAVMKTYSSIPALLAAEGRGPAVNAAATYMQYVGGPVRYMRVASSANGALSAVTQTGSGPVLTDNSSTPYENYRVIFEVTKAGARGTARMKYSLDNGRTWSSDFLTAATYTITDTGVSVAMATGSDYVLGTTYAATCTSATYTTTELGAAVTAINASPLLWNFLVLPNVFASATASNSIAGAVDGYLTTWFNNQRFVGAILDAGSADTSANIIANYTQTSKRIVPAAGYIDTITPLTLPGHGCPRVSLAVQVAMRAGFAKLSSNLGRVLDGPLFGSMAPSQDFPSPYSIAETDWSDLDDAGICVCTQFPNVGGWYLNRGRIKEPFGSDFKEWALLAIMNRALEVTCQQQAMMVNRTFKTNADGSIDKGELEAAQAKVQSALDVALMQERNAEGTLGEVSAVRYTIDPTYNTAATQYVKSQLSLVPRTPARNIDLSAGFCLA